MTRRNRTLTRAGTIPRGGRPGTRGPAWTERALGRAFLTLLVAASTAGAQSPEPPPTDPPPETEQFARLAGSWDVEMTSRNPDGSWAEPVPARWEWRTILDGHAVQDVWRAAAAPPAEGWTYGTNVRIYDPEAGHWRVAWTASDDRDFQLLTARMEEGGRLRVYGMHAAGVPLRITFFDVTEDTFRWTLEVPARSGEGWVLYSRLVATRARTE